MLNLPIQKQNGINVMSSIDLANICGVNHNHFMAKVVTVLKGGATNFRHSYVSLQNKTLPCYLLPERESCLMAMSYSYELQAKVYDAWQLLRQTTPKFAVPQTYSAALMIAAQQAIALEEKQAVIEVQQELIAVSAPKVDTFDAVLSNGNNNTTTTAIAKHFSMTANQLNEFLVTHKVMFKQSGNYQLYKKYHHLGLIKTQPCDEGVIYFHHWKQSAITFIAKLIQENK